MPLKIYTLEEDGKYKDIVVLESDKEASAKVHKSVYHLPEEPYTRVKPPKERDGLDRYFVDNKWEYREIVKEQEEEPVEQGDQDERTSGE